MDWQIVGFLQGAHYAKPIHDNIVFFSMSYPSKQIAVGCHYEPFGDECEAVLRVLYEGMDLYGCLDENDVMVYKM